MVFNVTFNNFQLNCSGQFYWRKSGCTEKTTDKLYPVMLYLVHLAWAGFELTTSLVIGTDCKDSCKSNYHISQDHDQDKETMIISIDPFGSHSDHCITIFSISYSQSIWLTFRPLTLYYYFQYQLLPIHLAHIQAIDIVLLFSVSVTPNPFSSHSDHCITIFSISYSQSIWLTFRPLYYYFQYQLLPIHLIHIQAIDIVLLFSVSVTPNSFGSHSDHCITIFSISYSQSFLCTFIPLFYYFQYQLLPIHLVHVQESRQI
jgi:hypothetical protein